MGLTSFVMLTFLDSANPKEIQEIAEWNCVYGITTNPSIMLKSGIKKSRIELVKEILCLAEDFDIPHVSVELTSSRNVDELVQEALNLHSLNERIAIKVPMFTDGLGLKVIRRLAEEDIPINATCIMSYNQAVIATLAGAEYVSFFYNRMIDYYEKTLQLKHPRRLAVREIANHAAYTRRVFNFENENRNDRPLQICGSIRDVKDIGECARAGADIVTIPYPIFKQLIQHPKTDEAIAEFDKASIEFDALSK